MKSKKILIIIFTSVIFSNSCIKTISLDIDNYTDSIVVNCLFSNKDNINVFLSNTKFVLDTTTSYWDTYQVLITDDTNIYNLENKGEGKFVSRFKPQVNKNYKLIIKTENYEIQAKNKTPSIVSINSINYIWPAGYNQTNEAYYGNVSFYFQDNSSTRDFYEVYIVGNDNANNFPYESNSNIIQNEHTIDYEPFTLVFSDSLFNGQTCNINFSFSTGYESTGNGFTPNDSYLIFNHISQEYYLYKKTLTQHIYLQQTSDLDIFDLFSGSPANVFSNINNGLGIFAGYSSNKYFLNYEKN